MADAKPPKSRARGAKRAPAKPAKKRAAKKAGRAPRAAAAPRRRGRRPAAGSPVVIVDGVRTAFAKALGSRTGAFESVPAEDLARIAIAELCTRTHLAGADVDEVILGCAGPPPEAPNIARDAALLAGLPTRVPAHTVQRNCGSALEAITTAVQRIQCGRATAVIAGGVESMSRAPMMLDREAQAWHLRTQRVRGFWAGVGRWAGFRPWRHLRLRSALQIGLRDRLCGMSMLETGDKLAREWSLDRTALDAYAAQSQARAAAAQDAGFFRDEITPVYVPPDFRAVVEHDDGIRPGTTPAALARLRAQAGEFGLHTAGNSSQLSDGAAVVLVMDAAAAAAQGYTPLGRVRSSAWAALEPERMGLGPALALPAALGRAGLTLADLDLVELNEAFAGVVLANQRALASAEFCRDRLGAAAPVGDLDDARCNVNGGAIALGHPVGATGARLVLTLLREMARRDVALGAATLCVGGGQGGAIVLERQ